MQRKMLSLFQIADQANSLSPWISTNRGTYGDGEFSNPEQLEKKGGFYGRGTWGTVDVHRIDTYCSIYIPTSHMPEVAAKFSFYGWVHHMLEPAIFVSVTRVHPYLPPLFDFVLENKISKEGELAGIRHIPWSDVSFSRRVLCPYPISIPVYLGEPVINAGFEYRNYSNEILSADAVEAVEIYHRMKMRHSDDYKKNNRPLTLEEAEETNQALKETADGYVIDKNSPYFRGFYTVSEGSSKNQIVASRCKEYINLMDGNNVEKKVVSITFSNHRNILWSSTKHRQEQHGQVEQEVSVSRKGISRE